MDNQPIKTVSSPTTVAQTKPKKGRLIRSEETKLGWLPDTKFTERQKKLIRKLVAPTLDDDEFNLFIYRCLSLRLDPLKGEISVHKRKEHTKWCKGGKCDCPMKMVVIVQRDGMLTVAHRTGKFNGLESDLIWDDESKPILQRIAVGAWSKAWNRTAEHPVYMKVYMDEYNTHQQVWANKPKTMIQKVAEAQALKKAFNINGVYDESELDSWNGTGKVKELPAGEHDSEPVTESQLSVIDKLKGDTGSVKTQGKAKKLIVELLEKK